MKLSTKFMFGGMVLLASCIAMAATTPHIVITAGLLISGLCHMGAGLLLVTEGQ